MLSELMARRGYARVQSAEAYEAAWREAAGPLVAKYSRVGGLRRGTLEVVVANSTLDAGIGFSEGRPAGRRWPTCLPDERNRRPSLPRWEAIE